MMHAAQVQQWGEAPKYIEVPTPSAPTPEDTIQVKVLAAGLHRIVRSRASGKHYSVKNLPHTPGTDCTGVTPDGQQVYCSISAEAHGGTFREYVVVPKKNSSSLPEGADPVQAAALVNPGMSSWMALRHRCQNLPSKFSILIMGATSLSGTMAVQFARFWGAGKVIGCARNEEALKAVPGLDESVTLLDPVEKTNFSSLGHVDVVLDYVYGAPAMHLLKSLEPKGTVQYVHVGSLAGLEMSLPGSVLRSKDLVIRGSGLGSFSVRDFAKELGPLVKACARIEKQKIKVCKLSDVERMWNEEGERVVFVP